MCQRTPSLAPGSEGTGLSSTRLPVPKSVSLMSEASFLPLGTIF